MYPGFERDVFITVAEHFQRLKEPLLTFHLYEIFVSILGKINTMDSESKHSMTHYNLPIADLTNI